MARATGIAAAVAAIAMVLIALSGDLGSGLRHAFVGPVVLAALRFGTGGGALAALAVLFLEAPRVFAAVERQSLSPSAIEAGVTCLELIVLGPALGALTAESRRQRGRYERLAAVQEVLAGDLDLEAALERLRVLLQTRLDAEVAIVAHDGERLVVRGGPGLEPGSPAAIALHRGTAVFVADVGGEGLRPRRSLSVPLHSRGTGAGALVVEREGELGPAARRAVAELGVSLGLALENARLASRQRRFTEELARRVAEVSEAKSAFVALASHELRTPLTALLGFSELLAVRTFPAAEVRRQAEIMRRETERLARLVDDFLDLSRLERGIPLRLAPVPTDIAAAIHAVTDLFRRGLATHRVVAQCPGALPPAYADPDAFDRILKNLVSNAMKYSVPGTEVRVLAAATGATVEVVVEDRGRGMSADTLARIFEPYYRAPDAAPAVRGTGLGLAVVKSLVDAQGGAIRVESAPGVGTRVVVQLRAAP